MAVVSIPWDPQVIEYFDCGLDKDREDKGIIEL
jgi:hypothetical protein